MVDSRRVQKINLHHLHSSLADHSGAGPEYIVALKTGPKLSKSGEQSGDMISAMAEHISDGYSVGARLLYDLSGFRVPAICS